MPGIVALVAAISADVVAKLAAAGYPALTDGEILLGRQEQFAQSAPPRIIFTPARSSFPAKDVYNRSLLSLMNPYSTEALAQIAQRAIRSDNLTFEVRCWGSADPPDPANDFDITQAYYQQVIASVHSLCPGAFSVENGTWTDSTYTSAQLFRDGREFVFGLTFYTPVLDQLLEFAPSNVAPNPTTELVLESGAQEVGCSG